MNIIYPAFYAGSVNAGYMNIYKIRAYRLVYIKSCVFLNVVNPHFPVAHRIPSIYRPQSEPTLKRDLTKNIRHVLKPPRNRGKPRYRSRL